MASHRQRIRQARLLGLPLALLVFLPGCQPDESPLKAENEHLRKQVTKQESVIASIQDGTKVMQQQIDLLNRELREAKKDAERAETERKELAAKLDAEGKAFGGKLDAERKALSGKLEAERKALVTKAETERRGIENERKALAAKLDAERQSLETERRALAAKSDAERKEVETERKALAAKLEAQASENRKLHAEIQHLNEKLARATPVLRVDDKGGQAEELAQPAFVVSKATEDALAKNGYTIRVSLKTDQKAVFVTERKISAPAAIELSGFRNQYFVSLQSLPSNGTKLSVRADFEKVAQGGRVLAASHEETAEIERRLIGEITKALSPAGKS